jgi:hypothetical protein
MSGHMRESLIQSLKRKLREREFKRAHQRHMCTMDGSIVLAPRMANLPGRMLDISAGGSMFRPALSYLMERRGSEVVLKIADISIEAKIVRTLPVGYALQFKIPLSKAELDKIVAMTAVH